MKINMYIAIVGIGVAIIGIFTLDWFKVGIGVAIFLGAFLFDYLRRK